MIDFSNYLKNPVYCENRKPDFRILFYGSALAFGLLQATNFTGNPWIILAFSPVLGSPQILLGFLSGYIRMKNGLAYSILFHMVVNLIALVL